MKIAIRNDEAKWLLGQLKRTMEGELTLDEHNHCQTLINMLETELDRCGMVWRAGVLVDPYKEHVPDRSRCKLKRGHVEDHKFI